MNEEVKTIRGGLQLALKSWETSWEPDDLDRDLLEPMRQALAALDSLQQEVERLWAAIRRWKETVDGDDQAAHDESVAALEALTEEEG